MQIRYYRVGDHPLSICFARDDEADQLLPSFARFRLDTPPSDPLLLRVDVDDRLPWDEPHHEVGHFDSAGNMYGVYLRADGGYQYEINDIQGVLCARVTTDATFGHVAVALVGETPAQRHFGLNNTLMLAYAFAAADRQTLLMHASVIRQGGRGYLMTAPSGTGKSTHARLWRERFGPRVTMVNDDKPLLGLGAGGVTVYGSPWDGKHRLSSNIALPLKALCLLRRGERNEIRPVTAREALPALLRQAYRPEALARVLPLVTRLAEAAPLYELRCNMEPEAAEVAWRGMNTEDLRMNNE